MIEEAGRSQFGAVLYRTTELFLRLFGLNSLEELPDIGEFDPSPELEEELRERLLRAGEARAGASSSRRPQAVAATRTAKRTFPSPSSAARRRATSTISGSRSRSPPDYRRAASCPQAASMSRPRVSRTVALSPRRSSSALKASIAFGVEPT